MQQSMSKQQQISPVVQGGIAGSSYGRLSYTYATGSVKTNKTNQYAGGICGDIVSGELTHSLALNSEVTANGANAHRIASNSFPPDPPSDLLPVLDTNYARPAMLLNNGSDSGSTTVTSPDGTSLDGARHLARHLRRQPGKRRCHQRRLEIRRLDMAYRPVHAAPQTGPRHLRRLRYPQRLHPLAGTSYNGNFRHFKFPGNFSRPTRPRCSRLPCQPSPPPRHPTC